MISVIICTFNRCLKLKETLHSFGSQRLDGVKYELIVVDNNSSDKTKEIVESFRDRLNITYVFQPKQGKSAALNLGIEKAVGEIVAFTDDDCILDRNWLESLNNCFMENNCDAVGGRIMPIFPEKTPNWVRKNYELMDGPVGFHDHGTGVKIYNERMPPPVGGNVAFKKNWFMKIGLYREDFGPGQDAIAEDTEMVRRLQGFGGKIFYCGTALVWHKTEKVVNLKYILKWSFSTGRYYARKSGRIGGFKCYGGIPRYLFKQIAINVLSLFGGVLSSKKYLANILDLSKNLGMLKEYREGYVLHLRGGG